MEKKQSVTPVLRILDEAKAREFYIDWLGFSVDWEHRFNENSPLYLQVSKNGMVLHLSEHYGDAIPGSKVLINMDDLASFHKQLKDYKYFKPGLEKMEWGSLEVSLIDPFGNHIVFTQESP